uniref:Cytochrome c oxidase subunit 3 n=1 Tax=Pseudotibiozus cerasopus TaxID=2931677 RepID=A0A8T9JB25_9MYRI|nr:cytochrome c oxidase subunit III [Pseudotibiozus cerasopus]UOF70236.1 cytochrome c oxidase subunit III [Pseudotibiozus cerasopus]
MSTHNHPYHLVEKSPWPLTASLGALSLTMGGVKMFHSEHTNLILTGVIILLLTMFQWWRDITRESTHQGLHTLKVIVGMKWGMILFIVSEILFFVSFFWAFFHSSLTPTMETGSMWPPQSIIPFNPFQIPLLNTAILLSSGVSVTWAHHSLMNSNYTQASQALVITVMLGLYFTALQAFEYIEAPFTIADSVYGSTFFMATGFHGLHVIIGTSFLTVCLLRHILFHYSPHHHFGFEAAAWYWHFVDVVWLFLYISIYWWGG